MVGRLPAQEPSASRTRTCHPSGGRARPRSHHPAVFGPVTIQEAISQPRGCRSAVPGPVTCLGARAPARGPSPSRYWTRHPSGSHPGVWDLLPSCYQPQHPSTGHGYFRDPSPDRYRAHYQYGCCYGDWVASPGPSQPRSRACPVSGPLSTVQSSSPDYDSYHPHSCHRSVPERVFLAVDPPVTLDASGTHPSAGDVASWCPREVKKTALFSFFFECRSLCSCLIVCGVSFCGTVWP